MVEHTKKPKVLVMDIETTPNVSYTWGVYDQDVIEVVEPWYIICFAYKWADERTTRVVALPDFKRYKTHPEDDSCVVEALWRLFNEADVIIAHNGDKFDIKKANARFLAHGLGVPSPYKSVDTLKIARSKFALNSNKLDDLGELLGVGRKVKHSGFSLWKGCMGGDSSSWRKMRQYNKQDVVLLEKVYKKLLPWATSHPSLTVISGNAQACPRCNQYKLQRNGVRRTQTTVYQQMICGNCGTYVRSTVKEKVEKPAYV